ncbi:MAG: adenine deaminase C-terminal domain-containing protein, partial [Methanocorpusculum sp.]|nr:adenine deaminase C-terminal domain-containing protein [Methanocorpusculum sp.]
FGLTDRGIIAPGKIADFCVLDSNERFAIRDVYKEGIRADTILPVDDRGPKIESPPFVCTFPEEKDLELPDGLLRVIGMVPGEILTTSLALPKTERSVQKIVCVDRYRGEGFGVGLLKGMNMAKGAIATSISHDAHNIIATGVTDEEILRAVHAVADEGGGMAVVIGDRVTILPLPCCGIMTYKPFEKVCYDMEILQTELARTGAVETAFMCLSFMALTVVPHLKITPRGLFDGDLFADVPLRAGNAGIL